METPYQKIKRNIEIRVRQTPRSRWCTDGKGKFFFYGKTNEEKLEQARLFGYHDALRTIHYAVRQLEAIDAGKEKPMPTPLETLKNKQGLL